jgi:dihydroxyacetone kinase-like protein
MLLAVARQMQASKDLLTRADQAVGDGDHGVGMARGFEAVQRLLEGQTYATIGDLLKAVGRSLMAAVGGAAGAVFGTLFSAGGSALSQAEVFDSQALAAMLLAGQRAVQERGKARPGDKTMVDALEPAAQMAQAKAALPLAESLRCVVEAAEQGLANTKGMVARVGKAKTLGERSLGHPDPGALSTVLLLEFMLEFVTSEQDL